MPGTPNEILLVTPVWNDSTRLAVFGANTGGGARRVRRCRSAGSSRTTAPGDDEHARLTNSGHVLREIFPDVELHFAAQHHGKGSVVREAWALAPDADWLAFVDADGSVTAEDLLELIAKAVATGTLGAGHPQTHGHHPHRRESVARTGPPRVSVSRRISCSICSARTRSAERRFSKAETTAASRHRLDEDGLAFDSELLSTLKRSGAEWLEIPVNWIEKKGGKVKPLRDAWGMLAALLRIRETLDSF